MKITLSNPSTTSKRMSVRSAITCSILILYISNIKLGFNVFAFELKRVPEVKRKITGNKTLPHINRIVEVQENNYVIQRFTARIMPYKRSTALTG